MPTTVEQIFDDAKARFVYQTDQLTYGQLDRWAAFPELLASVARAGGRLVDDCDGFATWCVGQMRARGLAGRYVFCQCETGEYHLVAEHCGQILDNRQASVLPIHLLPYRWISISGTAPGEPWREIQAVA